MSKAGEAGKDAHEAVGNAIFYNNFDTTQSILMGLKSEATCGFGVLGIGNTRAIVHNRGKTELLRDSSNYIREKQNARYQGEIKLRITKSYEFLWGM